MADPLILTAPETMTADQARQVASDVAQMLADLGHDAPLLLRHDGKAVEIPADAGAEPGRAYVTGGDDA